MNKKRLFQRLAAILISVAFIVPTSVFADDIDDIQAARDEIAGRISGLEEKQESLRGDEANAVQYSDVLTEKIDLTKESIDTARKNIKTLNSNITKLEKKLAESEVQYNKALEKLKERIKALYQTGDVGTVEILLKATSLYDFSLKSEMLKKVTDHDKQLMDDIRDYIEATKSDRDSLNKQKIEVASIKKKLESDQADLVVLQDENDELILDLQSQQSQAQSKISNLEVEDEELNTRMTELIAKKKAEEEAAAKAAAAAAAAAAKAAEEANKNQGNSGDIVVKGDDSTGSTGGDGEGMSSDFSPKWPLPGYDTSWITCYYGDGGHNGLDIAGNYGAEIVAAQAGEILSAEYHYSWGNNVLVYHNGTYSTRYAHMSSMAVSPGEYVERGQVIGYVGSTGNSSGNHLHFEVYENGSRVNPYNFL